ncbi:unnamed protein product [Paramecium primaurelia]|uniref:Transmembrane protein n=1 Tax=Paramecium primaurelia TaxID=5886 RepID=A0A8S1QGN2_PARPR|nr:unnamed protein product [Paramecium primaurelia]
MIGELKSIQIKNDILLRVFCQYKVFDINYISGEVELLLNNLDGNYQYIGSFYYIRTDYLLIIDQSNQKEISISQDVIFINPKCEKVLSVNFINENIIIYCNDYLYIYNNELISLKYELNNTQILYLGYLPFIIGFNKQGVLEFLKINNLPRGISNSYQQNILVFLVKQFKVALQPLSITIKKQSTPQLLVQIIQFETLFVNSDEYYKYHTFSMQKGLPFSISQNKQSNSCLIFADDRFLIKQYKNLIWGLQAFLIKIINIKDNIVFVIDKETMFIIDSNKTISYRIKRSEDYTNSQIIFCIEYQNFIIISNNTIKAFHYDIMIELMWSLRIKNTINKILKNNQILNIELQGCIEIQIQLDILIYQVFNSSLQFGCTYQILDRYEINITKYEINILPYFSNKLKFTFEQIIDFIYFVKAQRLVIFEVIEQKIILKLYNMIFKELYFCFNLPLYDFIIIYPLKYQIHRDSLAIVAKNIHNSQEVLLVYDLNNQLSNILIKVIKIYANQYYFTFLSTNEIISIYKSSLMITYLQIVFLKFTDQYLGFDTDLKHEQVSVEIKTDIYNFSQDIQFNIQITHFIYKLSIRDIKIPFIQKYDKQKQICKLNFDNIFGQIDSVYFLGESEYQKLDPIELTPFLQCRFYMNQVCYLDKEVILYNSGNQIKVKLPQECQDLIIIKDLSNQSEIFCVSGMLLKYYDIYQNQLILKQKQPQINFGDNSIQSIIFVKNIAIIKFMRQLYYQILLFEENNISRYIYQNQLFNFQIAQAIYENNHYVIFCYDNQNYNQIHIALLNENYTNSKSLDIKISQMILDYTYFNFSFVNSLLIHNHTLIDMIFQTDIILCFEKQNCFRINLNIDFQESLVKSHIMNYIKYPFQQSQLQYCLANQQNLIIALLFNEETVLYYYILYSTKILNSLYQYKGKNITIEYLNDTHFVQINSENSIYSISLLQFSGYQLKSNNSFKSILLNNSVSTLTLDFYPDLDENNVLIFSNILNTLICLINFILIILFQQTFKNRKIKNKKYSNN